MIITYLSVVIKQGSSEKETLADKDLHYDSDGRFQFNGRMFPRDIILLTKLNEIVKWYNREE